MLRALPPHSTPLRARGYGPQLPYPRSANPGLAARRCREGERGPRSPNRGGGTPSSAPGPLSPRGRASPSLSGPAHTRRWPTSPRPGPRPTRLPLPREVTPRARTGGCAQRYARCGGRTHRADNEMLNSPGVLFRRDCARGADTAPGAGRGGSPPPARDPRTHTEHPGLNRRPQRDLIHLRPILRLKRRVRVSNIKIHVIPQRG